jgi:hypothetical protein
MKGRLAETQANFLAVGGPRYAEKLAMVTTMWDTIEKLNNPSVKEQCDKHEGELQEEWRALFPNAKMGRFSVKEDDAWAVVDQVLRANSHRRLS